MKKFCEILSNLLFSKELLNYAKIQEDIEYQIYIIYHFNLSWHLLNMVSSDLTRKAR